MKKVLLLLAVTVSINTSAGIFNKEKTPEEIMNRDCNAGWRDSFMPLHKKWSGINGAIVANGYVSSKLVGVSPSDVRTKDWLKGWSVERVCVRQRGKKIGSVNVWATGILDVPAKFAKSDEHEVYAWKAKWTNNLKLETFGIDKIEYINITKTFESMEQVK